MISTNTTKEKSPAPSLEIERKWLVKDLPDLTSIKGVDIIQGYIAISSDGTEIRLRQKGDKYFQTIKTDGTLVRGEVEVEISKEQFDTLWVTTEGKRVEKVRYNLNIDGFKLELDIFKGSLEGLKLVEIEFKTKIDAEKFAALSWFGKDVTDDKRYKNKWLAVNGIPDPE